MKVAIMQPYFLPYVGYFQLMAGVDAFVVYDTIQYTKKGWINRNRFLLGDRDELFSLPLKADHEGLDVRDRCLADTFPDDAARLLRRLEAAYRKAPFARETLALLRALVSVDERNLFRFLHGSLVRVAAELGIATPILVSSAVEPADAPRLAGQDRVIDLCRRLGATTYVNPPGGRALYDPAAFGAAGMELRFLVPNLVPYTQGTPAFVPALSILDLLMHVGAAGVRESHLVAETAP